MFRHRLLFLTLLVCAIAATANAQLFTETTGFATKTGFRGVFAWKATQPVAGVVRYGLSPTNLNQSVSPVPGVPDTAQLAVASNLIKGSTYYWQVEDTLSGMRSEIKTLEAKNAYNSFNGEVYTINMLVQLDTESLPPDIPHDLALQDIANGMNIFAERLYDATDGYARLGKVIVTDTNLDYALYQPFGDGSGGIVCDGENTTVADVVVQTTIPFDSHTWGGWSIDNPCIGFYVGRIGQLVVPWEDELHFGYVSTHELMHYAFNAPDLYVIEGPVTKDCRNLEWDGSVMHNSGGYIGKWELTEVDRNPTLTPCLHGNEPYTWDVLRGRYTEVPLNPEGPIADMFNYEAKGHPDGDGLMTWFLDREPGSSTLTRYTADDTVPPCGGALPCVVDKVGDATRISTGVLIAEPDPGVGSDDNLDITTAFVRWNATDKTLTFHIKVNDLKDLMAPPAVTHTYRWYFDYNGVRYQVRASRSIDGTQERTLRQGTTILASGLPGSFNSATDEITITINNIPGAPALQQGEALKGHELYGRRDFSNVSSLTSDVAQGVCTYIINQENFGPNAAPRANNDTASTTEDIPVDVNVLANDSDPDGDPISVRSASTKFGSVSINANGTVRFTPKANSSEPMSFSYVVQDNKGGTSSATVNVTVTGIQDPPTAVADTAHVASATETVIDVLGNDSEPDGDSMTITDVTQGTFGRVANNGSHVTYTPGGGFATGDTFTYTVSDGKGGSNKATVTVVRVCLGAFSDDLEPLPENGWTFSSTISGVEGFATNLTTWHHQTDPLASSPTHSWFTDANDLSANKDDRLISPPFLVTPLTKVEFWHRYQTEINFDGGQLEISTDNGATWREVIDAGGVFEKGEYTITKEESEYDRQEWGGTSPGFPLMHETVVNLAAFAGKTAKVRWRFRTDPLVGDLGWWVDDIRFRDIGVSGICGPANNRMPDAADDSAIASGATNIAVLANDSDPDGDPIFVTSVTNPSNGTTTHNGSSVTYTANAGFSGTDHFFYSISDGFGGSDIARVTVTVNAAPNAANDTASTNEDQTTTIDVLANDTDANGDALSVVSAGGSSNGSVAVNSDGSISYTPNANFHGTDNFSYTVSDSNGATAMAMVVVSVASVNDSPVAANDFSMCSKNGTVNISVLGNDSDVDGDALSVTGVGRPVTGSVTLNPDGSIRYRAKKGFTGTDNFTYAVSDGNGGVSSATVTVSVVQ